MRKFGIFTLMVAISATTPSFAQHRDRQEETVEVYMSGDRLVDSCRLFLVVQRNGGRTSSPRDAVGVGTCLGFIEGVLETTEIERLRGRTQYFQAFCIPRGTHPNAIAEVVLQYLEANPQRRSASGYALVRFALTSSFPC